MLSHQSGDLFLKGNSTNNHNKKNTVPEITLQASNGSSQMSTQIKYITGTTTGLDVGYDAGKFNAGASSFDVYSHLVSNSQGVDFTLQCLPQQNYEDMVIPIGLTADKGTEVTFTLTSENFPDHLDVYLEDTHNNTFTKISEQGSTYQVTLNADHATVGHFYLHTTSRALSTNDIPVQKNISIYPVGNQRLRIVGMDNEEGMLEVYDLQGKQLMKRSLSTTSGATDVSLPSSISEGVYVVQLSTESRNVNKKIVINPNN